jgi:serine/threonine protein kinase
MPFSRSPAPRFLAASWPEFAVKIVSTSTMRRMGYESRVRREVAVLSTLTHPSIARLVSAFRWHDGAYLVLEYASQVGDDEIRLA